MKNDGKILVVDDDRTIVYAICRLLEIEGFETIQAFDGLDALDKVVSENVSLILIDVMMPRMDGLSAMMQIRQKKNIPIIVLSAKSENSDKVLGLSMGADDYITKPYNPTELVARVRSNLRRYLVLGSAENGEEQNNENILINSGLCLDLESKQLSVDGEIIKLTATEYKITELLMKNPGKVFSADEIYREVWNEESYSADNTVMVHIRHIREKVEINPKDPKYIKVVWGIGYKIEAY